MKGWQFSQNSVQGVFFTSKNFRLVFGGNQPSWKFYINYIISKRCDKITDEGVKHFSSKILRNLIQPNHFHLDFKG